MNIIVLHKFYKEIRENGIQKLLDLHMHLHDMTVTITIKPVFTGAVLSTNIEANTNRYANKEEKTDTMQTKCKNVHMYKRCSE